MTEKKYAIVIDDDLFIRELLKSILSRFGYETVTYKSPLELPCCSDDCKTQCFKSENPPDIIITDIKMPGMTGIEFLFNVREKGCKIKKRVIISGYWEDKLRKEAEQLDSIQIEKPFKLQDIQKVLESQ